MSTSPTSGQAQTHPPSSANSRFQQLFTEEDEVSLLKSFFETTKSVRPSAPPAINSYFLEHVERSLSSNFSHTQIIDKLRRLRLKCHKHARTKSLIKTPHDRRVYNISRKIWGKHSSHTTHSVAATEKEENLETVADVVGLRKEETDLEKYPLLAKQVSWFLPNNAVWKEGVRLLEEPSLRRLNEKWTQLRIEEARLLARKAELAHEQIKVALEAVAASQRK